MLVIPSECPPCATEGAALLVAPCAPATGSTVFSLFFLLIRGARACHPERAHVVREARDLLCSCIPRCWLSRASAPVRERGSCSPGGSDLGPVSAPGRESRSLARALRALARDDKPRGARGK